jgi:hypothetical protein
MGKKSKKLMKAAALAGAAYLASKTMAPKEKKGYLSKFTKIDYKGGDRNPTMPGFEDKYEMITGGDGNVYRGKKIGTKVQDNIDFGGPNMMLSPKKGGYIKAKNGTMISKGQGMVMRPKKTIIS